MKLDRLIFFVTSTCNCTCAHCFYWKELNTTNLTNEEIKKIFGPLEIKELMLSGGEPFMRPDLEDLCDFFITNCKVKYLSIPTNGTQRVRTMNFVKKFKDRVNLRLIHSLDGLKETHNKIRGLPCFDMAIQLLKDLTAMGINSKAMITAHGQNINEIPELVKFLEENKLNWSITPIRGAPKDSSLLHLSSKQWQDLMDKLPKNDNAIVDHFYNKMYRDALDGKRNYDCYAGKDIAVIESNGNVKMCELTGTVANLRDNNLDFEKIWNSPSADVMRASIQTCVCTHTCFIRPKVTRYTRWMYQWFY